MKTIKVPNRLYTYFMELIRVGSSTALNFVLKPKEVDTVNYAEKLLRAYDKKNLPTKRQKRK